MPNKSKKHSHKSKKEKKSKNSKKPKTKKRKESTSNSDDSEVEQWVEKLEDERQTSRLTAESSTKSDPDPVAVEVLDLEDITPDVVVEQKPKPDDDWMSELIPTFTRDDLRAEKNKVNEPQLLSTIDQPGQHPRELNPFWKDGGVGLPSESSDKGVSSQSTEKNVSGGSVVWLEAGLLRCEETAAERGCSVEEVAVERWGSLGKLKRRIAEAKRAQESEIDSYLSRNEAKTFPKKTFARPRSRSHSTSRSPKYSRNRSRSRSPKLHRNRPKSRSPKPPKSRSKSPEHSKSRSKSPKHSKSRSRSPKQYKSRSRSPKSRSRSPKRYKNRSRSPRQRSSSKFDIDYYMDADKHKSDEPYSDLRQAKESRSFKKPTDDGLDYYTDTHRRRSDDADLSDLRQSKPNRGFKKPTDHDDIIDYYTDNKYRSSESYGSDLRQSKLRGFKKPTDDDDDGHRKDYDRRKYDDSDRQGWRKKPFAKPTDDDDDDARSKIVEKKGKESFTKRESSESSTSSDEEEQPSRPEVPEDTPDTSQPLTDAELNQLGAKILRAEMMGDTELVEKLKAQLEAGQKLKQEGAIAPVKPQTQQDVILLTRTGRSGMVAPLDMETDGHTDGRKRKHRKVTTHDRDGRRERYFGDDDRGDLKSLVEKERLGTSEDETAMFARLASKVKMRLGDDSVDDLMIDKAATSAKDQTHVDSANRLKAIMEHKKLTGVMDKCRFCFEKTAKHLMIAMGKKVYLSLPSHTSLAPGHCLIIPMQHTPSSTALDEDVFNEIQLFRKSVTRMFSERGDDCVFMEMSRSLHWHPHMKIECVPVDKELGDVAPIYFKKALMECESEWAQNTKLVDLSKKDVRRAIPKGFPYFAVDFGLQGGYAHVIEDERQFPEYFGREVVGGMLDAEPTLWRKPREQNFNDQSNKVLEFAKWWKPFDCTQDS